METDLSCRLAEGEIARLLDPVFLFNCVATGQDALGVFLGAVFAVVAWLLKTIVQALAAHLRRRQDLKETLIAMIANIERSAEDYRTKFSPHARDQIIERIWSSAAVGTNFVPYSVAVREDFILDRIKEKVSILPERLVDPVTRYIYASDLITEAVIDFRSAAFTALPAGRKVVHLKNIYAIAQDNAGLGFDIVRLLKRHRRVMRAGEAAAAIILALGALLGLRWLASHQW